jgi:hypothetical protein
VSDRTFAVQYWSASKGAFQAINEMATPHLSNAIKKLEAVLAYDTDATQPHGDETVLNAMKSELAARNAETAAMLEMGPLDEGFA